MLSILYICISALQLILTNPLYSKEKRSSICQYAGKPIFHPADLFFYLSTWYVISCSQRKDCPQVSIRKVQRLVSKLLEMKVFGPRTLQKTRLLEPLVAGCFFHQQSPPQPLICSQKNSEVRETVTNLSSGGISFFIMPSKIVTVNDVLLFCDLW